MPIIIQSQVTRGWRAPLDQQGRKPIYIGQRSKLWRNPWGIEGYTSDVAFRRFKFYLETRVSPPEGWKDTIRYPTDGEIRKAMRGRNLMCYCDLDVEKCHGTLLLEIANR